MRCILQEIKVIFLNANSVDFCVSELLQPLDVPEFNGTAFVELPLNAVEMIENMMIAVWFKAVKPDGKKTFSSLPALIQIVTYK